MKTMGNTDINEMAYWLLKSSSNLRIAAMHAQFDHADFAVDIANISALIDALSKRVMDAAEKEAGV